MAGWLFADSVVCSPFFVGTPLAERPVHLPIRTGKKANYAPSTLVSLGKAYGFDEARQSPGFAFAPKLQIEKMDDPIEAHRANAIMASVPQRLD